MCLGKGAKADIANGGQTAANDDRRPVNQQPINQPCGKEGSGGPGTAFDCLTRVGPFSTLDRMTVTTWTDAESMGVTHSGVVTGQGRFDLSDSPGGTTLTWTESLVFPWWMLGSLGASVAAPILRALWRGNLRRFARTVPGA